MVLPFHVESNRAGYPTPSITVNIWYGEADASGTRWRVKEVNWYIPIGGNTRADYTGIFWYTYSISLNMWSCVDGRTWYNQSGWDIYGGGQYQVVWNPGSTKKTLKSYVDRNDEVRNGSKVRIKQHFVFGSGSAADRKLFSGYYSGSKKLPLK
jgi:hypothetical protein